MAGEERRLTHRLTSYWNLIRKEAVIPDFAHFNAATIQDIWQQCILFTVQPSAPGKMPQLSFYMVGDKIRPLYKQDMQGQSYNPTQRHFQGASLMRKMNDILAAPAPMYDEGQFVNEQNIIVKYRSCLLPFGREGKVTHVLIGLSWRDLGMRHGGGM